MKLVFFKKKDKLKLIVLACFAFLFFYMLPNHISIFTPKYLNLLEFEKKIPFLSWTIWVYMSDYVFIVLAFYILKDRININRMFYSFIVFCILSMFVFYLYPVTYPRPVINYEGINGFMFAFLHSIDTPSNCMPSLHVGMSYLLSYAFLYEQRVLFFPFFIWATLISFSTLTTKQHYFVDIIGGIVFSLISIYLVNKLIVNKFFINFDK
jgi:membrane-associated phospholipid phosphatase